MSEENSENEEIIGKKSRRKIWIFSILGFSLIILIIVSLVIFQSKARSADAAMQELLDSLPQFVKCFSLCPSHKSLQLNETTSEEISKCQNLCYAKLPSKEISNLAYTSKNKRLLDLAANYSGCVQIYMSGESTIKISSQQNLKGGIINTEKQETTAPLITKEYCDSIIK